MIPNVPREKLLQAMEEFDKELRGTEEWSSWEQKGTYKFAIVHDDKRYPVKQIISMAAGEPKTNFSGGYEANSYVSKRGFSAVPLRSENADGLSVRDGLEEILAYYASARANEPFKGHALRLTFDGVSHAIAATNAISRRPTIRVKASMGQGNWATIPWISVLDSRETNTTQHGVYCVYLFREDLSGVYLALAQGVTEPKEQYGNATQARAHLRTRAEDLRAYCEDLTQYDFALDNSLDLHAHASLGTDYEASTIAHKFYAAGSVPDDSALIDDLEALLSAYDRYLEARQAPWFEPLEHPPRLEAELQLILERSNRKEQDLLAAIFRRAILLHQRRETEGYLGAQRKILQRFSIKVGNVYACAVGRNSRETLYLLVDDDTTLRETYEVGDASFSRNELMWIHGRLDRDSLQSLIADEAVWNAYGRMLPKVTNYSLARSNHNNRGKLSVISGKPYDPRV